MLKTRKRWISLLVTLTFLFTLAVPFAGPAGAAGMYTCSNPLTVADDTTAQKLGTIFVEVPAGELNPGDILEIELASDYDITDIAGDDSAVSANDSNDTTKSVSVVVPSLVGGDANALKPADVTVSNDTNKVTIKVNTITGTATNAAWLRVYFNKVDIASGATGDIVATMTGFGGFVDGSVVIGRVVSGAATVSVKDTVTLNGDGSLEDIIILENVPGGLDKDAESVKLILPSGFEWGTLTGANLDVSGGFTTGDVTISKNKSTLYVNVKNQSTGTKGKITLKSLPVTVDESKAKYGDIKVKVKGESSLSPSELLVGKYTEFGLKIELDGDKETVYAGQYKQELPDINVVESTKGSLVKGRTITLTLPSNAKWVAFDDEASDSNATLKFSGFIGSDYRTIKYIVDSESNDAAEITLEGFEVALEPGVTGTLTIEVGGTAGLKGEVLEVADVVNPVSVTVDVKDVKIGVQNQVVGDIVIKEAADGAILEGYDMIIDLPDGVKFAALPKVEVTDGDLDIDESGVKRTNNDNQLVIPIDNESNDASTITISGVRLTLDRTVAEGDLIAKLQGNALVQVNNIDAIEDDFNNEIADDEDYYDDVIDDGGFFPNTTSAVKFKLANVVTPAPGETKGVAVFTIGDAKYTLNGAEVTMDVAPYIKDGRTMVPVRFAANAVGVADSNILWDAAAKKVTVIKGDRVVQMTIGSKVMLINGAAITMDAAPEITNGRTMLPIRFLGQALGAEFVWDATAQTVTVNF